ncbi:MAG: 4-(cytidine 5'-diphospho)-2-C-methyl-D-erythritol kinase [Clostridia bacterium]|nr:4-(cytidine 5'-diphospho)-2-C-methyl-D-erythritol kinase [Clostridia bacterium]
MAALSIRVPGKINLSLDVVGRRPDGYHLLSTIMQTVDVCDVLSIETVPAEEGIRLSSDRTDLPLDARNTAYRAAEAFRTAAGILDGLRIHIEKQIPVSAGMGGGSADAAGVLTGLDRLYPGRLDAASLAGIGASIGADVPFCLTGGTALCEGIGEYISPLPPFSDVPAILVKPGFGVSTAWVFAHLDRDHLGVRPDNGRLIRAMAARDLRRMAAAAGNVLESVTVSAYPLLAQIKRQLTEAGAGFAAMSGSGPTVFGLFDDEAKRDRAAESLAEHLGDAAEVIATHTA